MVPPRYAWITYGWYPESFWKLRPSNGTSYQAFHQCSREQTLSIISQMIVIHHYPRYDERDTGNLIIGNLVSCRIYIAIKRNTLWKRTTGSLLLMFLATSYVEGNGAIHILSGPSPLKASQKILLTPIFFHLCSLLHSSWVC